MVDSVASVTGWDKSHNLLLPQAWLSQDDLPSLAGLSQDETESYGDPKLEALSQGGESHSEGRAAKHSHCAFRSCFQFVSRERLGKAL